MKAYNAIDSSTDFGAGWNTFGRDDEGVEPMLREGVGGLGSDPQAFKLFSTIDQRQIIEEIERNPRFGRKLEQMLHEPNAVALVSASAKRAFLNEMDGSFPGSKGEWITLRQRVREIVRGLPTAIQKQVGSMSLAQQTRALNAMTFGGEISFQLGATAPASSGNIWGDIIGGIATAAATIYTTKLESDAKKKVAKLESQTAANQVAYQTQLAQAQAALEAAKAKAAAEAAAGGPVTAVTAPDGTVNYVRRDSGSVGGSGGSGSMLMWAIPLGLGVLGFIVYMVMRSR